MNLIKIAAVFSILLSLKEILIGLFLKPIRTELELQKKRLLKQKARSKRLDKIDRNKQPGIYRRLLLEWNNDPVNYYFPYGLLVLSFTLHTSVGLAVSQGTYEILSIQNNNRNSVWIAAIIHGFFRLLPEIYRKQHMNNCLICMIIYGVVSFPLWLPFLL
jgi:hypothetical protein